MKSIFNSYQEPMRAYEIDILLFSVIASEIGNYMVSENL